AMSFWEAATARPSVRPGRAQFLPARSRRGLRASFLRLRHPLEALEVDEGLGPAQHLGGAQADQELLGRLERPHAQRARADALEDVRIRARAHEQVVLPGEAQRLVVEAVAQEPRVV